MGGQIDKLLFDKRKFNANSLITSAKFAIQEPMGDKMTTQIYVYNRFIVYKKWSVSPYMP